MPRYTSQWCRTRVSLKFSVHIWRGPTTVCRNYQKLWFTEYGIDHFILSFITNHNWAKTIMLCLPVTSCTCANVSSMKWTGGKATIFWYNESMVEYLLKGPHELSHNLSCVDSKLLHVERVKPIIVICKKKLSRFISNQRVTTWAHAWIEQAYQRGFSNGGVFFQIC